jgi:hypothetical protein
LTWQWHSTLSSWQRMKLIHISSTPQDFLEFGDQVATLMPQKSLTTSHLNSYSQTSPLLPGLFSAVLLLSIAITHNWVIWLSSQPGSSLFHQHQVDCKTWIESTIGDMSYTCPGER